MVPDTPLAQQKRFAKRLEGMTASQLEAQANRLLFGTAKVPNVRNGEHYVAPKIIRKGIICDDCARPRSHLSASLCRACYSLRAKKKRNEEIDADAYSAMLDGGGFENEQRVAVSKPQP